MRFIGGPMHEQPVPAGQYAWHVIDFPRPDQRATLRYVRTGHHFVIFGMSPANAAPLIAALETPV